MRVTADEHANTAWFVEDIPGGVRIETCCGELDVLDINDAYEFPLMCPGCGKEIFYPERAEW